MIYHSSFMVTPQTARCKPCHPTTGCFPTCVAYQWSLTGNVSPTISPEGTAYQSSDLSPDIRFPPDTYNFSCNSTLQGPTLTAPFQGNGETENSSWEQFSSKPKFERLILQFQYFDNQTLYWFQIGLRQKCDSISDRVANAPDGVFTYGSIIKHNKNCTTGGIRECLLFLTSCEEAFWNRATRITKTTLRIDKVKSRNFEI